MSEFDIVAGWLKKAAEDLDNAKFMFENKWPRPLELICYLCSQSAEKVLKAYITYKGMIWGHYAVYVVYVQNMTPSLRILLMTVWTLRRMRYKPDTQTT